MISKSCILLVVVSYDHTMVFILTWEWICKSQKHVKGWLRHCWETGSHIHDQASPIDCSHILVKVIVNKLDYINSTFSNAPLVSNQIHVPVSCWTWLEKSMNYVQEMCVSPEKLNIFFEVPWGMCPNASQIHTEDIGQAHLWSIGQRNSYINTSRDIRKLWLPLHNMDDIRLYISR